MPKIHAHFQNMLVAQKAIKDLKGMGYNAHLDAPEKFKEEYSEEINFAGTRTGPSLSALVLKSRGYLSDIGKAPLIAASPMVSGSGSFQELADGISTRLIVSVDDGKEAEIKEFLKESGAMV